MQAVFNHIETIKMKPHRERKQIAIVYAAVASGAIAVLWLGVNLATGSFALRDTNFTDTVANDSVTTVPASGLAGAAGAQSDDSGPARIQIVDTASKPAQKPEPTTIPF
ncbi:MAG TPA: hypothetical protein VFP46_02365 [Candidatus Paceibacterota bacterium]|nr:hypothetical protein [Candidatus Paceibacterota bacterium]